MSVKQFDELSLYREVLKSNLPSLIEFGAEWCGPCKNQEPILDQIASEYSDKLIVAKVDIDDAPGAVSRFKIRSVPTLLLIQNEQVLEQKVGLTNLSTLKKILNEKLGL